MAADSRPNASPHGLQYFVCQSMQASHALASHLHELANDWALPRQRKGAQLAPGSSRNALCAFDGNPCSLFKSANATLNILAMQQVRPLRVVLHGEETASTQRLVQMLENAHGVLPQALPKLPVDLLIVSVSANTNRLVISSVASLSSTLMRPARRASATAARLHPRERRRYKPNRIGGS